MPPLKDVRKLGRSHKEKLERYRKSLRIEHKRLIEPMRKKAEQLTSGKIPTETFIKLRHPLRRKNRHLARGRLPRLPINEQEGTLKRSLRVIPTTSRGKNGWRLQFTARHSKFVLARRGTKRMLARGFWTAMQRAYDLESRKMERRTAQIGRLSGLRRKYSRRRRTIHA